MSKVFILGIVIYSLFAYWIDPGGFWKVEDALCHIAKSWEFLGERIKDPATTEGIVKAIENLIEFKKYLENG